MSTGRFDGRVMATAAFCAGLAIAPSLHAQTNGTPERLTALAVNTNGGTTPVEIAVDRWSTNAERNKLLDTLRKKGPEQLLSVLQDMRKVGFIRQTSSIGWDLRYARREAIPDGGGERIVVATDRPIGNWEAINQPRTVDYPFTVIELHLNANGEGEGKMTYATKITEDKKTGSIVLENWGTGPVLLQGVHRESFKR
jgi:hypothetical protein